MCRRRNVRRPGHDHAVGVRHAPTEGSMRDGSDDHADASALDALDMSSDGAVGDAKDDADGDADAKAGFAFCEPGL